MVVVYNTKTPDMDTVQALATHAIAQANKAGITLESEPDSEATHIGGFEFTGNGLYAEAVNDAALSAKPDAPSP